MDRHKNTPLISALNSHIAEDRTNMHMPGHKQGKGFDSAFHNNVFKYDLTELHGLDNFHNPTGAILKSMVACSEAFGALRTFFLVNGSTSGIHACFLSCFKKGDKVLVNRNCHISVINAMILFGVEPIFVVPEYYKEYNLPLPASFDNWKNALNNNPDIKGAFITSPDYYGFCQPIGELSALLHEHGKILLVDEAHGAHFAFSKMLPKTALEQGADICVQSFHKTLPALTQSAVLHIGSERVDEKKVQRAISMLTTTSPSYILMSSMDYARDFAVRNGAIAYEKLLSMLDDLKKQLMKMEKLRFVPNMLNDLKRDPTRIVVDTSQTDISGVELYDRLYNECGIAAEMCDTYHVVFILTMADTANDIEKIGDALTKIDKSVNKVDFQVNKSGSQGNELVSQINEGVSQHTNLQSTPLSTPLNSQISTPKYSVPDLYDFLDSSEQIPIEDAEGCTSAGLVTPYPPGIPILCPGETISLDVIKYIKRLLKSGLGVHGLVAGNNGTMMVRII